MRSICVFCGAAAGQDTAYADAAADFGRLLGSPQNSEKIVR